MASLAQLLLHGLDVYLVTLTLLHMVIIVLVGFQPISVPAQRKIIVYLAKQSKILGATPFGGTWVFAMLCLTSLSCASILGWQYYSRAEADFAVLCLTRVVVRAITSFYLAGSCLGMQHLLSALAVDDGEAMMMTMQKMDMKRLIDNYEPLSKQAIQKILGPYESAFSPEVHGSLSGENVHQIFGQLSRPKGGDRPPLFFVCNHALLGLEMALFIKVFRDRGISVRGLGDFGHWMLPGWRNFLEILGCIPGSRENVNTMFEAGEDLLVYPGGGHEIMKPSSVPKYTLMWKQRTGFARCAIQNGATIIPCCSVGTEDMLHTIADVPAPLRKKGLSVPIAVPTSGPQRIYFWFGEPIQTDGGEFGNDPANSEMAEKLRDVTKASVEDGIARMRKRQAVDPGRYLAGRIAGNFGGASAAAAAGAPRKKEHTQ
jgi:1-acyl-sn-glycerol-3-phosphate acyltransferase